MISHPLIVVVVRACGSCVVGTVGNRIPIAHELGAFRVENKTNYLYTVDEHMLHFSVTLSMLNGEYVCLRLRIISELVI